MSDGQTLYSFRIPFQNVLQREVAQVVRLEARREGALVAPLSGTFSLFDSGGTAVIDAQAVTILDLVATYSISALELPDSLAFSELYQERWSLVMPDGTTRTPRRETAIAPFLLYPALAEIDITAGEYPGLVNELGDRFDSLQPFLDNAWGKMLEWLFEQGQWPAMMLSTSAFRRPHREWTLYLIFKYLFRNTGGGNRWQVLMEEHKSERNAALAGLTSRIDQDKNGLPDGRSRQSAASVIHINAGPYRRLPRNPKW